MTSNTITAIRALSSDSEHAESLIALLNYYKQSSLMNISEEQALLFLNKVKSGEIRIYDYLDKP